MLITGRFIQGKQLQRQLPAHQPLFQRITDAAIIVLGSMGIKRDWHYGIVIIV